MMPEEFDNIRQTPLGTCIGATIVDITAADPDEFMEGDHRVFFHLSNGETIFATIGTEENPGLLGMLGTDDEDEADAEHAHL
jgi:hypothetical protein